MDTSNFTSKQYEEFDLHTANTVLRTYEKMWKEFRQKLALEQRELDYLDEESDSYNSNLKDQKYIISMYKDVVKNLHNEVSGQTDRIENLKKYYENLKI